jgi:hypothetical protein
MDTPFEKFKVSAAYNQVGQFYVHVWPTRYGGAATGIVDESLVEAEQQAFIEQAIHEKLDRASGNKTLAQ